MSNHPNKHISSFYHTHSCLLVHKGLGLTVNVTELVVLWRRATRPTAAARARTILAYTACRCTTRAVPPRARVQVATRGPRASRRALDVGGSARAARRRWWWGRHLSRRAGHCAPSSRGRRHGGVGRAAWHERGYSCCLQLNTTKYGAEQEFSVEILPVPPKYILALQAWFGSASHWHWHWQALAARARAQRRA